MGSRAGSRKAHRCLIGRPTRHGLPTRLVSGRQVQNLTEAHTMNTQALTAPVYPLPPGVGKLTAFKVAHLSKPGRYCDGAGLYLQISPKGAIDRLDLIAARFRVLSLGLPMADTGLAARMNRRKSRALKTRLFCVHGLQWQAVRESESSAGIRFTGLLTCTVLPTRLAAGKRKMKPL